MSAIDDSTRLQHMRNRLVHAYFDIDLDIVWQVVTHDLPPLLIELHTIINLETDA